MLTDLVIVQILFSSSFIYMGVFLEGKKLASCTSLLQGSHYLTYDDGVKNGNEPQYMTSGSQHDLDSPALSNPIGPAIKLQAPSQTEDFDGSCHGADEGFTSSSPTSVSANGVHAATSSNNSPFYQLRIDATTFVSQTMERGRRNLWQLTTSRVSALLSCSAVSSASTLQFLKNYEDLNIFILAGEAFSGVEASELRQRLRSISESYMAAFHRQNVYVSIFMTHPCGYIFLLSHSITI